MRKKGELVFKIVSFIWVFFFKFVLLTWSLQYKEAVVFRPVSQRNKGNEDYNGAQLMFDYFVIIL